ncbi:MAG TPA: hypothetical protein DD733_11040 [Clostridiales bacterium]|nr:RnfABCDGE type electron transport complex subunit G [Eubacteriales bacterium]HBR32603.1 hypothetical protein [Clostridiales bacterium]
MRIDIREITKPALRLFIVCFIVTALLAATYTLTAEKIKERAEIGLNDTRREVLPEAETFEVVNDSTVFGRTSDGRAAGYIITVVKKGYGGDMEVMVGFTSDGSVSGVGILKQSETPGMGAKTDTSDFLSQYKGLNKKASLGEEIDGITGATISSRAVTDAVNEAIESHDDLKKGEENE